MICSCEGSMPHGRDALAARFTRAWSTDADAPTIAIHLKPWRERSRINRATFSRGRAVFFIGATIRSAGAASALLLFSGDDQRRKALHFNGRCLTAP
jgi:Rad3-related DNA helicase